MAAVLEWSCYAPLLLGSTKKRRGTRMTVEMPTGGRIEAELMPVDDPFLQLSVRLGKSGNVVYKLPAMLKMGFRVVECTPGELAVMEAFEISFTGSPPPLVRLSTG
jgi:hypothetical protein